MRKIGDNAYFEEPADKDAENRRKEQLEKNLDPRDHQFLTLVFGGQRLEVPLKDFIAKYGSPEQYDKAELAKYVLQTWMKKNLG